eukprot:21971-Eustigmatos_ZCMA.PRE.1
MVDKVVMFTKAHVFQSSQPFGEHRVLTLHAGLPVPSPVRAFASCIRLMHLCVLFLPPSHLIAAHIAPCGDV